MPYYTTDGSYTASTTATTCDLIWTVWSTAAGTDTSTVYSSWVSSANSGTTSGVWSSWMTNRIVWAEETEEQKCKRRQDEVKRKLKLKRERRTPQERAAALLRRVLTDAEWADWKRYNSVMIQGSLGGRYEIGASAVLRLDENWQPVDRLCYHPSGEFCAEDRIAATVLDIKCNEARVRQYGIVNPFSEEQLRRARVRRYFKADAVAA